MAEAQPLERSFVGPPKKLIKRRYDREKRSRSSTKKRNMFSWENVDGVRIPYIFRGDRKYVLVSVINEQLLARYPRWYPEEIRNCPPLLSVGITAEEADMLNQMEKRIFGDIGGPFLTGDLIVELDAALSFYATLRDHYKKGGSAPTPKEAAAAGPPASSALLRGPTASQQPATPVDVNDVSVASADASTNVRGYVPGYSVGYMHVIPDGWILVNNAVVPCIRRITAAGQFKLLPLPVVEEGIGKLDIAEEILSSPVECFVLSAMCRAVGHQFTFPAGLKLVGLGTVLESRNDVFLHRLSDQDPFQCASDIINRRMKDDELVEDLLPPTYGNKATSADCAFAEEHERPRYGQRNSAKIAPHDLGTINNKLNSNNNSSHDNNKVGTNSDEGFAEVCAGEILDLSTHRPRRPPEPGYDVVPKPTDLSEKSGTDRTNSLTPVIGTTSTEPARDAAAVTEQAAASKASFQAPVPVVEGTRCVNLLTMQQAANESKTTSGVADSQRIAASGTTNAVIGGSDIIPVQAADTQPRSSVQCRHLMMAPGNDLRSMNPPVAIPRGKKRKASQTNADINKRKIKRNRSNPKKELQLTCFSNQNGQHLEPRIEETRNAAATSGPCSLYALALKKCKTVYGEGFPGARRLQPEKNPLKGHLKKWLLTKNYKAKTTDLQQAVKRVANDKMESSSTKKAKLHKSARKRSKLDDAKSTATIVIHINKVAQSSSSLSAKDGKTPREAKPKPTNSPQQGVPTAEPSKQNTTRRIPTLCELVDEINKPPVKFKRKCPFTGINRLPKLPFLGLNGPHTLSSVEFGMHQKPSVKKGIRTKVSLHKRRKHFTSGDQAQTSTSPIAEVGKRASDPEARMDSGVSENTDAMKPHQGGLETAECVGSNGPSPGSKGFNDTLASRHPGAVCRQSASSENFPLQGNAERVDHTKQTSDGNHLMETSSIIAQTNQLLEGRTNCDKELLSSQRGTGDHCSTEATLRLSGKSDVTVAEGTGVAPSGQDCRASCGDKKCDNGKAQVGLVPFSVTQAVHGNIGSAPCAVLSRASTEVNPVSKENHISCSENLILRPITEIVKSPDTADHISSPTNAILRPVTNIANSSGGDNHILSSQNAVIRPAADSLKRSGGASGSVNPMLRPVDNAGSIAGTSSDIYGARIPMLRPVINSGQRPVRASNQMFKPITDIAQSSGTPPHIDSTEKCITGPVSDVAIVSGDAGHVSSASNVVLMSVNNVTPSSVCVRQAFDSVDKTVLAVRNATMESGNVNDESSSSLPVCRPVQHTAVPFCRNDNIQVVGDVNSVTGKELPKPTLVAVSVNNSVSLDMRLVNALGMPLLGRGHITHGVPLPGLKPTCDPDTTSADPAGVTGEPGPRPGPVSNGAVLSRNPEHAVGISEAGTIVVRSEEHRNETTIIPFSPVSDAEEEASGTDCQTGTLKESGVQSVSDVSVSSDAKQIAVSEAAAVSGDVNCVKGTSLAAPDSGDKEDLSSPGANCTNRVADGKPVVEQVNGIQNNPDVTETCQLNECSGKHKDPDGVQSEHVPRSVAVSRAKETAMEQTTLENLMRSDCRGDDTATGGRQVLTPGDQAGK